MENPEEILHSLEEFSKMKPKDIPGELEEYLVFVAKTGDPIYQWASIKSLFREKLINVITEFYESCPVMEIPPCPNVDIFNYDLMKSFILEKLEAFNSAPFTLQRICELLTTPRKEYNRIDKFMRALEKNILVVSTVEPGGRRSNENGEGIMNGIENEPSTIRFQSGFQLLQELDEPLSWGQEISSNHVSLEGTNNAEISSSNQECIISCTIVGNQPYVSIEPLPTDALTKQKIEESLQETNEKESEQIQEPTEVPDTIVSEPDISQEIVEKDSVSVNETETKPQKGTDTSDDKNDAEMPQEETNIEVSEEMQQEESVSKDIPLEVEKVVENTETPAVIADTEVVSEVVSQPMGIENISPETSTESPEALEGLASVETETQPETESDLVQKEESTEEVKASEEPQTSEEVKESVNTNEKVVENTDIVEKSEEKEPENMLDKEEIVQDRGDIKIDVETIVSGPPTEDITEVLLETVEKVKESVETEVEPIKLEKIEIENVEVEPMNVTESSITEKASEEDQKVKESTAIEVDPLKIDDTVEEPGDKEKEITTNFEPAKTETLQSEESTPMEVDVTETAVADDDMPKKELNLLITEEKEAEPNQSKSDS